MKKTYINPTIKVVKIETRSIIASSVEIDPTSTVSAESAESRSSSFGFGDEE